MDRNERNQSNGRVIRSFLSSPRRARLQVPAPMMLLVAMFTLHTGSALAVTAFDQASPATVTWLRLTWAALILLVLGGPSLWRAVRAATPRELGAVVILGTASAGMMLFYSEATARIELGTATSIEFLGTLVVAVAAMRRRRELVWIAAAVVGVVCLTRPWMGDLDLVGVGFALAGAVCVVGYIVLTQRVGSGFRAVHGLALAMTGDRQTVFITGEPGIADTKLAFVAGRTGAREMHIADYDGFGASAVTQNGSINLTPVWSPDARSVAYLSYKNGYPDLFRLFPFERRPEQTLAAFTGINSSPAWSADGGQIALTLSKDGNPEIYVLTVATGVLRRLTRHAGIDTEPTWSPTGRQLAFISNRAGSPHVFVMDAEGANVRQLTFGGYQTQPRWSPKGDTIAYTARSGTHDVWAIQSDGSNARRLTAGPGDNQGATWAPNGRHLMFQSNRLGGWQIFSMLVDGSAQIAELVTQVMDITEMFLTTSAPERFAPGTRKTRDAAAVIFSINTSTMVLQDHLARRMDMEPFSEAALRRVGQATLDAWEAIADMVDSDWWRGLRAAVDAYPDNGEE